MTGWLLLALLTAGWAGADGLEAAGDVYRAVVAPEGGLLSWRVGGAQVIAPVAPSGDGSGRLRDAAGRALPVRQFSYRTGRVNLLADQATVSYRFHPGGCRLVILSASESPLAWSLQLAPGWSGPPQRLATRHGERLAVETDQAVRVRGRWIEVDCPPLTKTVILLTPAVDLTAPPPRQPLTVEPRTFSPGRFVLQARPPDLDFDGRHLTVPLLLANRGAACSPLVSARLVQHDGSTTEFAEPADLPARDETWFDARFPTPPPGIHRVEVSLPATGARAAWTVAFAPEQWPQRRLAGRRPSGAAWLRAAGEGLLVGSSAGPVGQGGGPPAEAAGLLVRLGLDPRPPLPPAGWAQLDLGPDTPAGWPVAVAAASRRWGRPPLALLVVDPTAELADAAARLRPEALAIWSDAGGDPGLPLPPGLAGQAARFGQPCFAPPPGAEAWIDTTDNLPGARRRFVAAATAWLTWPPAGPSPATQTQVD